MSGDFDTERTHCVVCGSREGRTEASGIDYIYEGSSQICTALRCTKCDHIYLNPRPTRDAVGVLYPPNYTSFSGKFTKDKAAIGRLKEWVQMQRISKYLDKLR